MTINMCIHLMLTNFKFYILIPDFWMNLYPKVTLHDPTSTGLFYGKSSFSQSNISDNALANDKAFYVCEFCRYENP